MAIEAGRFLRLKSMVDSVLVQSKEGSRSLEGKALADAYAAFRDEARGLAESVDAVEEFDRLFQPLHGPPPSAKISDGFDPFAAASYANEAAAILSRLSGWLNGFVEEARMSMEADAYAKARLEQERRSP